MVENKVLCTLEELDRLLCKENIFIYGAGKVAKAVIRYASGKKNRINGVLVSMKAGNPSAVMGVPVCEIDAYKKKELDCVCLIIAVMEGLHGEIEEEISGYGFGEAYFVSDKLFEEIVYQAGSYELDCLYKLEQIEKEITAQERRMLRFVSRPCLEYMVLNVLDHCNLRCKGCDHFACVADPYFVSRESIHQDLDRLSELFHGDYIMQIAVMGGEPLLHPDLLEILEDVRTHFPYTKIRLTTNGLLLLKQKQEFWRVCRENDVTIVNTKYPINLRFDEMQKKAVQENVKFQYFEGTGDHMLKKSFKKVINLKGDSNPVESFAKCHISNYGNFLMEGKFYSCPFSCQSYRIFNKKFKQNLRMTEKDFLDIYKVENMQEVFDFAARPKYYCRYCSGLSPLFDWERSKQEISEWVDEEK